MTPDPTAPPVALRRPANPWLVAGAVVIPTFMEVLDTTIANVALRYIAGGLSAPAADSEWVITSYLAANAVVLPISGWLGGRLGRRNYFLLSIAVFTLASGLCGAATSLGGLVAARVLQGLAGGGLQPSSQAVLLDTFPPARQGLAMTLFGVAALLAPVVGPTLGGYVTDTYGWRWIFYLNIPVGLLALALCHAVVTDPPYLTARRAGRRGGRFDGLGLGLLAVAMLCWEVLLSKGQEWDWLGDPFRRVHALALLFALSLCGLVIRELRVADPLIDLRTLGDRNFRACCAIGFGAFALLYANTTTLPGLLQSLFGYDATRSGLVLSPAGVGAVLVLLVTGALLTRGVDARHLIAAGLLTLVAGNLWMSRLNLEVGPWQVVWPRVAVVAGLSMIVAPLNVAAFRHVRPELRGAAVGLLALLRNEGGSVGTSVARTVHDRRGQFHALRLNEGLDPLNPAVAEFLARGKSLFAQRTGNPPLAEQLALAALEQLRLQQASSLAYFDVFWASAVLGAGLVLLVPLLRRSAAARGAHVAAE
ncbi:MAG TPA: MDR family MFS transporter [Humisphaera sp.]